MKNSTSRENCDSRAWWISALIIIFISLFKFDLFEEIESK